MDQVSTPYNYFKLAHFGRPLSFEDPPLFVALEVIIVVHAKSLIKELLFQI